MKLRAGVAHVRLVGVCGAAVAGVYLRDRGPRQAIPRLCPTCAAAIAPGLERTRPTPFVDGPRARPLEPR